MPPSNGDDFQDFVDVEFSAEVTTEEAHPAEESETDRPELEVGPRAERPNFLTATRFVDFDLPPEIMEGLDSAGFEYCTPIQAQAIPVAMRGLDIAGQAQTGTGKTTAFLAPMLNRLLTNKPLEPGVPRAIIVTPTRELALQIYEDARVLAQNTNLRQVLVIGGMEYKEQAEALRAAPEIVICTPGRVIDYIQQGVFKTRGIEVAVVDEADRLLDMGFIKDLKYILSKLPPFTSRQTMLFSATLDERVLELTYQYMNPPQYITAEPDKATKVNIEQELYHIGRDEKLSLLLGLLRREEHRRVIIFSNTKSGVEWLAKKLTLNGFQAEGITGDLPQPKRLKLMEAFKENRLQILVATDVASRGIHVDDVSHVYNYDLPQDAENYIHRIGRTARAGHSGKAVSFGCEDYVFHLEAIENLLGEKIPVVWPETEWFQEDLGGDVRLKDRRGDRVGRRGDKRGGPPRESRGEAPRLSRGPAKSQRAGGIFGLSPRLSSGNGLDAVRQSLEWGLEEAPALMVEAEPLEINLLSGEPAAGEAPEKEGQGRRRKRRRNKQRGRETAVEAGKAMPTEETAPGAAAPVEPEAPAPRETAPEAAPETAPEAEAKPGRKPRRQSVRKPARPAEAEVPAPVSEAAAPAVEAAAPEAPVKPARGGRKKAAEKPEAEKDRYPKKRVSVVAVEAETPPPAEEKPKRGRPKKTAEPLEAAETAGTAEKAKARAPRAAAKKAAAEKSEAPDTVKAPRKTAAKKTAEEKPAGEKPARAPAKKSVAKKESAAPDETAPVKKTAARKSAADPAKAKEAAPKAKAKAEPKAAKKAPAKAKEAAPAKKAPAATAKTKAKATEKEAKPAKGGRKKAAAETE